MKRDDFSEKIAITLAAQGLIKKDDISTLRDSFDSSSYENFEYFLIDEKIVEKDALLSALSTYYHVPFFDVMGYFFDHTLVCQFPEDILKRNVIIPLEVDDNGTLVVIAGNPNNHYLLEEIGRYVSYDIELYVGLARDIIDSVEEFYDPSLTISAVNEDNDIYGDGVYAPEEKMHIHRNLEIITQDIDDIRGDRK